ncbi:ubiquitin carboxyl-terminal hydrolase 23-like [Salvia hispanica]|uniref:ubiquitin carboxyl-terminal hydrolase 23-like n=1 Tax=Salvia hispanica TaxID=49212 RepID=UPI0020096B8C|nr:ubiquitin carboxyl-terminal hydrolase 23-like [Salvia hispanica]
MAETAAPTIMNGAGNLQPESDSALFHRRIEFHLARKHFNGFGNESSNGFKLVTLNPTSGPLKASGLGKKTEKSSEHSEAGLDPELSFEITFRRIGAGLRNLGNTCFLNSVLQCLTYTAPLAAYLQSGKHQNSCRTAGFCALCAIQKHVSRALQSSGRILEPKDLVSNLRCISRSFRNARQEDAHEYMVNLLESMHKCCLPSGVPSESPSAYEKSLVHKIFGGRLRSQVKCTQCSYCSNKFDPFLDLSLEINRADSLYKALSHFTTKELLDGGAREYQCDQCKQKVKASKQLTVHKAPQVLAVHLKRFSSHAPGQKVDKKVTFEPTLDMKPFVTGSYDGDLKYTLYGVLVHYGWSTHSGHYYCFVRTSSGMWYSLDDNQVVQVNERKVLEQKAYMLFYVRDRKNVGTNNHANALQKNNMNAIGNAAYSKLNLEIKEKIVNGSNERKINGSAALSRRDAPMTALPKEKLTVEHQDLARNAKCKSMVQQLKAPQKEDSAMELNSSVNGSGGASNGGHVAANTLSTVEKHNTNSAVLSVAMPSSYKESDKEKPSESAEKAPDSAVLRRLSGEKSKMDGPISETNANGRSMLMGAIGKPEKNIRDGQGHTSCIEASSMKTVVPNTEMTVKNGQRIDVQSKLSDLPSATTEPLEPGKTKKKRRDIKVKRKLFKYQAVTTSLSSNIILGAGLCLRRKKHKKKLKKKHSSMQEKSPDQEDMLVENGLPSKLGQSAPVESMPSAVDQSTCSRENKAKCVSDGQNQNSSVKNTSGDNGMSSVAIDKDFKERILLNGSTGSAEKQPDTKHPTVQGTVVSEERQKELRQNDVMNMLTRGLEETTVGRWDGIDVSLSTKSKRKAAGTAQIGYIGDEWDEEYDRGKRKKVRVPIDSYDGPNLFQEVANKRLKTKSTKLDRSRGANQPFRI